MAAVFLPSVSASCLAQSEAWQCADERLCVSLWSADAVQGTQMRFAPDGSLWVVELRGKLLRLTETAGGVCATIVFDFAERARSADPQTGATSLAFGPDFNGTRGTLYVAHNWDETGGRRVGGVSRVVLAQDRAPSASLIYGPIASGSAHQVSRLLVDKKGDLLVSVGDIWQPELAQREDGPHGKILRFDSTALRSGEISIHCGVEAKGLRNAFAMAERRSDGAVVLGHNGPDADDGLLWLKAGANYGWGSPAGLDRDAMLYRWPRTVSPNAVCFYETDRDVAHAWPREYGGNLFVGLLGQAAGSGPEARAGREPLERGRQVLRMILSDHGAVARVERACAFLSYTGARSECPIDLTVGPEGDLFLMTFDVDAASRGSSKIYRVRANRADRGSRVVRAGDDKEVQN